MPRLCFLLQDDSLFTDVQKFDRNYQSSYKKLATFLYKHPEFKFSLCFSGPQLRHYQKKRPEFIGILRELVSRGQVELVGGGYYFPALPFLIPQDRCGQVERLTTLLRDVSGARPRGLFASCGAWDFTVVFQACTCGMEYAVLEREEGAASGLPKISSYNGRTCAVLEARRIRPERHEDFSAFCDELRAEDAEFSPVLLASESLQVLFERKWLERLASEGIEFLRPCELLRSAPEFEPQFMHAEPLFKSLRSRPERQELYDKMLYMSRLLENYRGCDKARRDEAKKVLWKAQCGAFYLEPDVPARQAYEFLAEAEGIIRSAADFKESFVATDYNCDGMAEYVCRAENFSAVVFRRGGCVRDMSLFPSARFYAAGRTAGLFADCVSVGEERAELWKAAFSEVKCDVPRRMIRLEKEISVGGASLLLQKKIQARPEGFRVQYILKNSGGMEVSVRLSVGFCFDGALSLEVVSGRGRGKKRFSFKSQGGRLAPAQVSAICASCGSMKFLVEPNEAAELSYSEGEGRSLGLEWDVRLEAGYEIEKTVYLTALSADSEKEGGKRAE